MKDARRKGKRKSEQNEALCHGSRSIIEEMSDFHYSSENMRSMHSSEKIEESGD